MVRRLEQIGVRAEVHEIGVRPFHGVADVLRAEDHRPITEEPLQRIDFVEIGSNAVWRIRNLPRRIFVVMDSSLSPSAGVASVRTPCPELVAWTPEMIGGRHGRLSSVMAREGTTPGRPRWGLDLSSQPGGRAGSRAHAGDAHEHAASRVTPRRPALVGKGETDVPSIDAHRSIEIRDIDAPVVAVKPAPCFLCG